MSVTALWSSVEVVLLYYKNRGVKVRFVDVVAQTCARAAPGKVCMYVIIDNISSIIDISSLILLATTYIICDNM